MARMRTLKPEAATSESLAEVDRSVRWTFAMLWTHCDDSGRAYANTRIIKAAIYPLDDDITPAVVAADLKELERIGAVCFYTDNGREYIHVPAFHGHQRPNKPVPSKLPPCPKADHSHVTHVARTDDDGSTNVGLPPVVVVGVVDVIGVVEPLGINSQKEPASTKPRRRAQRIPDGWTPSPTALAWQEEKGISNALAERELEKFGNYWRAKSGRDGTKQDWDATWRNWLLNALERQPATAGSAPRRAIPGVPANAPAWIETADQYAKWVYA